MKTFERILKDELLIRTSHLLDCRQHGFLSFKSCTTNMVNFTDKLVISINDTQTLSTDVIYFDFSKASDSVNHDLILHKLKYAYAIDGSLSKYIMNYLGKREQSVVLDGINPSSRPVLSGVPQGSILVSVVHSTHLDNLSFVSNIALTTTSISNLNKSFFFRSHTLWNFLPFNLRNSMRPSQFKIKLVKHYWKMAATDNEQS